MKATLIYLICLLPILSMAQTNATLTISGKSTTEVTPDITVINLSLSAVNMDYAKSIDLLQDKSENIKTFLINNCITKEYITSENFNINKTYNYENRQQVFQGYNATLEIKLEFLNDNALANKIINAIGESNSEAEINVNFKLSQVLKDSVNNQLIESAIQDARKKALIIAQSTDQKLGRIIKINYGVNENVGVSPYTEKAFFATANKARTSNTKENLSITPQALEKSTEIIIYWLLIEK